MFTPRRTLLLLAGFMLFGVAYGAYSRLLGWLDGLPQLPAKLLERRDPDTLPPQRDTSPTQAKLARAFGPRSPETDYALYETQIEFRNGETSIVVAAGPVPANPNSNRIPLSPFSLAIFSKPKPAHLRQPGEVSEISTVHADKAILEFDRVIKNSNDMRNAKLVRLELVSDFGGTFEDPRRGMVHITNNQRSDDPNRYVVIRTPGPVFYRDAKAIAGTPATQGPDFWTDAPVEIVDRQNLPRPIGSMSPATVLSKSEELRHPETISDIVAGRRSPPPTVTAIGFRLYLEPDPPPGQPRPKKNTGAPLQGVRRFEFLEQVVVNLWVDNKSQSFMGGGAPATGAPESGNQSLALTPPPVELAAVAGGLGPAAYTAKLQSRALLQVETRGPFAYDSDRAIARFDVVPLADPKLPNDVQVTKVSASEGKSSLFSQVLELELNGGPTSGARAANTPALKRIHAWTITPGRYLTVTSQDEAMQAYGQDLVHDPVAHRTILIGPEVHVIRDRNVLKAGTPQRPATLTMEPGPAPAQSPQLTVLGPGRVDLVDSSSEGTFTAEWQTSLVQSKETINGREQDLFVFTDAARFEDRKTDYWLRGKVLKLWLEPQASSGQTARASAAPTLGGGQPKPARIQAIGDVKSHSAEYDVEQADQLNVFFEDMKAPVAVAVAPLPPPAAPAVPVAAAPVGDMRPAPPAPAPKQPDPLSKEAEKKQAQKPPMRIWAKDIQTRLHRVPAPAKGAPPKAGEQAAGGTKYQLHTVECEDNVVVRQAPTDPTKTSGIYICGQKLHVDGSPDGNVLTVHGWQIDRPAEVHQEDTALLGPVIVLDQIHNLASVKGRGALSMPTSSDLTGGELKQPEMIVVQWRDEMDFRGASRSAKFIGKVFAHQGESWVLCHTMHVTFDRPIYFNQVQKQSAPKPVVDPKNPNAARDEKPKIDTVSCFPAPADSADTREELFVHLNQVERDKNQKIVRLQRLKALEMKLMARTQDPAGGEKYQSMSALGPGELRIWQPGDKDFEGPGPNANQPMQPAPMRPMPKGQEQEMKLTFVTFEDRMDAFDKGKVLQQATFTKDVKVINVPTDSPNLKVEGDKLPPRAMLLYCRDKLVVGTHKKGTAPPVQSMEATGNSYLRTEDYEGWGDKITLEDKLVVLTGNDNSAARFRNRNNRATDQPGKKITYDRSTGAFKIIESYGGAIGNPK